MSCKICLEPPANNIGFELINNCICDGSIKWTHTDCLEKWKKYGNNTCPDCKTLYTDIPKHILYSQDATYKRYFFLDYVCIRSKIVIKNITILMICSIILSGLFYALPLQIRTFNYTIDDLQYFSIYLFSLLIESFIIGWISTFNFFMSCRIDDPDRGVDECYVTGSCICSCLFFPFGLYRFLAYVK